LGLGKNGISGASISAASFSRWEGIFVDALFSEEHVNSGALQRPRFFVLTFGFSRFGTGKKNNLFGLEQYKVPIHHDSSPNLPGGLKIRSYQFKPNLHVIRR